MPCSCCNGIVGVCIATVRREGSPEVPREWRIEADLPRGYSKAIEQASKQAVKRSSSLQELSRRAMNGDSKSDPQSLFTVNMFLDQVRVSYIQSFHGLLTSPHSVTRVAKDVISVVSAVRCRESKASISTSLAPLVPFASGDGIALSLVAIDPAASVGKAADDKQKSYYEMIRDDADIWRIVVQIMNGMSSTATESQTYLPSHLILAALLTRLAAMLLLSIERIAQIRFRSDHHIYAVYTL